MEIKLSFGSEKRGRSNLKTQIVVNWNEAGSGKTRELECDVMSIKMLTEPQRKNGEGVVSRCQDDRKSFCGAFKVK